MVLCVYVVKTFGLTLNWQRMLKFTGFPVVNGYDSDSSLALGFLSPCRMSFFANDATAATIKPKDYYPLEL